MLTCRFFPRVRAYSGDSSVKEEAAERIDEGSFRLTSEGLSLGNKVSGAESRAGALGDRVDERNHQSIGTSLVSPVIKGAENYLEDAKGWISDTSDRVGNSLGIGGGGASGGGPANSVLPRSGEGFRTYSSPDRQYGTESVVNELRTSSAEWAWRGGSPVNIGDVSKPGGGDIAGHETHEQGRQVDIRPFRRDGGNAPVTWQSRAYDREQTRSYIEFMKDRNPGTTVLFNDPVLVKEGLTHKYEGHDNHLHFSFPNRK